MNYFLNLKSTLLGFLLCLLIFVLDNYFWNIPYLYLMYLELCPGFNPIKHLTLVSHHLQFI